MKKFMIMLASVLITGLINQCWADQPAASVQSSCPCNFSTLPTNKNSQIGCAEIYSTTYGPSSYELNTILYTLTFKFTDMDKIAAAGDDKSKKLQSMTLWEVSQRINTRGLEAFCMDGIGDPENQVKKITKAQDMQSCINDIKQSADKFGINCQSQ